MATRTKLDAFPVISSQAMTANIVSSPTNIQQISKVSYDISWTGTPTGTFSVQVSDTYALNPDGTVANTGNWSTLPLSAATATGGTSGSGLIDIETGALWIRLVYNFSSGTGTLNATISGKVA